MSSNTNSLLAGILATSGKVDSVDSLDSIDVDYSSNRNRSSFVAPQLDNEFDIPEVDQDNLPSLESILNEADSTFHLDDLGDSTQPLQSEADPYLDIPGTTVEKKPLINGAILRHVALRKISGQMLDACARRDAGLPTAIAANSLVAIGTSHGLVLVFEPRDQALKVILGTTTDGAKYGAVTALGINVDCTRLLSGYAKGQIQMWDLSNGSCLRTITDAHPLGYAVLHLQFTDDPTVAMCNDSSGSVYSLSFKRVITRTCESSCFFSGSKGEVCTMAPLHLHPGMKDHPLYDCSLLAMASLTKLIIVNLKPAPVAIFIKRLPGKLDSLPILSWQFAVVQLEEAGKQFCPVLAFARDTKIHFIQVFKHEKEFKFMPFQFIETDYHIISLHWLSPQIIATIDRLEKIHVVDVKSKTELECLDLGVVRLVYGSSYFKSLSTGGNVSQALKAASNFACYQSVQVFNGQLLLLGTKSINCLNLRNWLDRLEYFVKQNLFLEALQLALSFYEDTAMAVVGLTANKRRRKELVAEQIVDILLSYIDIMITVNCPKTHDEEILSTHFRELVPLCVKYSIAIANTNLLFTEVYDRFVDDPIARKAFLECLEPFILDGQLKSLSAVVMQDFVELYENTERLKDMESCLVMLDVSAIDLHHMVKLCWIHELYDAVIYVYNRGLKDFITPLEQLLRIVHSLLKEKKQLQPTETSVGLKVFVYISCCLAGRQYPIGEIEPTLADQVKNDVYECLVSKRGKFPVDSEQSYPYLRTLLAFDTREFLNVLSLAFEEPEFGLDAKSIALGMRSRRQSLIDLLLQIMIHDDSFSPSHVGCLFTFIARQMAKFESTIKVNQLLFEQVLEYLSNPDDDSRHEERQQALLDLLFAGGLKHFEDERLLALAESARFYRVCEHIYQKKRQFAKVLSCYYRDSSRKAQVFSYLDGILRHESFTGLDREDVAEAVLGCLDQLVVIDGRKLARLILRHFPAMLDAVSAKLQSDPEIQFSFLKGAFSRKHRDSIRGPEQSEKQHEIAPDTHERFIELLCIYDPLSVLPYLRESDNYRLEQTLCIVKDKGIVDATAYLLEKTGDFKAAFDLLLSHLVSRVSDLNEAYVGYDSLASEESKQLCDDLDSSLQRVISFCQRASPRLESDDRHALWFPLLETVMAPQRRIKDMTSEHFLAFKEFTKVVLTSMMGYIALPAVLQTIMNNPAYSSGKFGEIKELLLGMLDTYTYELTLLETTKSLLGDDLFGQYKTEYGILSKGYSSRDLHCQACGLDMKGLTSSDKETVLLFRCFHSYHKSCLENVLGYGEDFICILCNSGGMAHRKSTFAASPDDENSKQEPKKNKEVVKQNKILLSPQQEAALDGLRNVQHGQSVLGSGSSKRETSQGFASFRIQGPSQPIDTSSLMEDSFQLRLAPAKL